jgi:hypothetical protein
MTALALAGVLAAGACGGNDSKADARPTGKAATPAKETTTAADFCSDAKSLYDQLSTSGAQDPTSPQVKAVFAKAKALQAPKEIASDWNAILDQLIAPVVTGQLDIKDPQGANQLASKAAQLGSALQHTGTYFHTKCGFG